MAMTCEEMSERMVDLLYGELSPEDRPAVDAHIAGCDRCRAEVEAFQQTRAMVRGTLDADPAPPARVRASILAAAAAHVGKEKNAEPSRNRAQPRWSFWDWIRSRWTLPTLATVGAVAVFLLASQRLMDPAKVQDRGHSGIVPAEPPAPEPGAATAPPTEAKPSAGEAVAPAAEAPASIPAAAPAPRMEASANDLAKRAKAVAADKTPLAMAANRDRDARAQPGFDELRGIRAAAPDGEGEARRQVGAHKMAKRAPRYDEPAAEGGLGLSGGPSGAMGGGTAAADRADDARLESRRLAKSEAKGGAAAAAPHAGKAAEDRALDEMMEKAKPLAQTSKPVAKKTASPKDDVADNDLPAPREAEAQAELDEERPAKPARQAPRGMTAPPATVASTGSVQAQAAAPAKAPAPRAPAPAIVMTAPPPRAAAAPAAPAPSPAFAPPPPPVAMNAPREQKRQQAPEALKDQGGAQQQAEPSASRSAKGKKERGPETLAQRADRLFAERRWVEAAVAYHELLRQDPHSGDAPRWRQRLAVAEDQQAAAAAAQRNARAAPASRE